MFQLAFIMTVCQILVYNWRERIEDQIIIMGINAILQEISKFFSAVLSTYSQIPRDLKQQIKTMQAFLRSYDQKQLFLIQNFVRRIQSKTQKVRYLNQRKNLKTEPDYSPLNNQQNKENQFNFINVFNQNHGNNYAVENVRNVQEDGGYKVNRVVQRVSSYGAQEQEREMARYKNMFNHYSRNGSNNININHSSLERPSIPFIERPLSIPKQRSHLTMPGIYSSRDHSIKPRSSPYLQSSTEDAKVNCSVASIEPEFAKIQLPQQFKMKEKSHNNNERQLQKVNSAKLVIMKKNARQMKEMMENNKDITTLKQLINVRES